MSLVTGDDSTDPSALRVEIEYQFGGADGAWHDKPIVEPMANAGSGRFTHSFGPYLPMGHFRIRFTVRATDAQGLTAQLPEMIIQVVDCPPPPPVNQPPTISWVNSANGTWLSSASFGFPCVAGEPGATSIVVNVTDDHTAVEELDVQLVWIYGTAGGWLANTAGAARMTHEGGGRFSFPIGPYALAEDHLLWYFVQAVDPQGGRATTEQEVTLIGIHGCVVLI